MPDPAEPQRNAILEELEHPVRSSALDLEEITSHQLERFVAQSSAISLRRIADALECIDTTLRNRS